MIDQGVAVRLSGYRLPPGHADIIAPDRRAPLLVVDPASPAPCAHAALAASADEHDTEHVAAMLALARPAANTTQEEHK